MKHTILEPEEQLALLKQVDRLGLSDEMADKLIKHFEIAVIACEMLDMLTEGKVNIAVVNDLGEPGWVATQKLVDEHKPEVEEVNPFDFDLSEFDNNGNDTESDDETDDGPVSGSGS